MGTQVYVDETKAKGYLVAAVVCPDAAIAPARKAIGRLVLPGQRSLHMKSESPRRRGLIADSIAALHSVGLEAVLFDAGRGPEPEVRRRDLAFRALVGRMASEPAAHLVIDLDQTLVTRDARTLTAAIRSIKSPSLTSMHQARHDQPLLALPDAVAWCWARGGEWRRRMRPFVSEVIRL